MFAEHGTIPVETYRDRAIYRTADRTLVVSPDGHEFCVEHPGGESLHTEASVEACKQWIDEQVDDTRPTLDQMQNLARRFQANEGQDATYWLIQAIIDIEYLGGQAENIAMTREDIDRAVHSLNRDCLRVRHVAEEKTADEPNSIVEEAI